MNVKLRILIVAALVLSVLAMSGGALAGKLTADKQAPAESNAKAGAVFQGTGLPGGNLNSFGNVESQTKSQVQTGGGGGGGPDTFPVGGGCATYKLIQVAPGGNWTAVRVDPLPSTNGTVLSCAVKLDYSASGQGTICFAVPPGKDGKIVYWDTSKTPPVETVLETTVTGTTACAPANQNGVYALVGQ